MIIAFRGAIRQFRITLIFLFSYESTIIIDARVSFTSRQRPSTTFVLPVFLLDKSSHQELLTNLNIFLSITQA